MLRQLLSRLQQLAKKEHLARKANLSLINPPNLVNSQTPEVLVLRIFSKIGTNSQEQNVEAKTLRNETIESQGKN